MIVSKIDSDVIKHFDNRTYNLDEYDTHKPRGLWFGLDEEWINFCLDEGLAGVDEESIVNYYDISNLNLYVINSAEGHPIKDNRHGLPKVDFAKIQMQGYDGILYQLGYSMSELFFGWDVNSVVIWQNQGLVKYIETKKVKDLNL